MVALLALPRSVAAASAATVALLTAVVVALALGLGLGLDDDVHPAIITVAPAITTSTKMRCFLKFSFSYRQSPCRFRLLWYALFV